MKKLNPKQEKFCQRYAETGNASRSYMEAGYACKSEDTARKNASRALTNADIASRIRELKETASQTCLLTKVQAMEFLARVVTTPAGSVGAKSDLCQSYKIADAAIEIKMPDKLKALELLAKMCGWNEPDRVTVSVESRIVALIADVTGVQAASQAAQIKKSR